MISGWEMAEALDKLKELEEELDSLREEREFECTDVDYWTSCERFDEEISNLEFAIQDIKREIEAMGGIIE